MKIKQSLAVLAVALLLVTGCRPWTLPSQTPSVRSGTEVTAPLKVAPAPVATAKDSITVGYCSEDYASFDTMLVAMAQSFYDLGMLSAAPDRVKTGEQSWRFIGEHLIEKEALRFSPDHYYNLNAMSPQQVEAMLGQSQVDLMIVMGSTAASRFIQGDYPGDYIVAGVNDVYKLGAIQKESDSGYPNRCAAIYDNVYDRQIEMLCDTVPFDSIGIVYQNTPQAAEYSGAPRLRELSEQNGFVVEERFIREPASYDQYPAYLEGLKEYYQELAPLVDVFYLSINLLENEDIAPLLEPFYQNGVPIISQRGGEEVAYGALFGINMTDEVNYGRMVGEMIMEYLSGKPIRYMSRVFQPSPVISINRQVAQRIGYRFDIDTLLACDQVYGTIKGAA